MLKMKYILSLSIIMYYKHTKLRGKNVEKKYIN